jgi:hypothetical protein
MKEDRGKGGFVASRNSSDDTRCEADEKRGGVNEER